MPDYTINVPDVVLPGLNKIVGRYNADHGTDLDVRTFLELHARELAIQEDLATEHERLAKQAEVDVAAAVRVARERLLSDGLVSEQGGQL